LKVPAALSYPLVKLFNRVLSDYPMAREQLAAHAGKVVAASVGPIDSRVRVTAEGATEMIGEGTDIAPDVSFQIPLSLLPRLAQKEEAAFREVVFSGDSEFAALLARLAREIEWDIEEDLSKWIGDIAAHRVVDTVKRTHEWRVDATQRFTENVAEYLTEERRAFVSRHDLETLAIANETLRDDVARLEARLGILIAKTNDS
jgi:ubiquinone biosynthesis accessory factor UbiJ